jgi:SWI/SNF related-matrix-associated actin-dependent regulator of chromatin subfamily C
MDGRYPANWKGGDFQKIENTSYSFIPDRDAKWSDAETLLLLEALELHEDDWGKISDYIGTRTREECVMRFLQLDMEDSYVEPDIKQGSMTAAIEYLSGGRVPLSQADNPVLSVMAYLAGLADPSVAAAAAERSVKAMTLSMRRKMETGYAGSAKGKERATEGGAVQESDSEQTMEVERYISPEATALAMASARAAGLASHEERNLTKLVHTATNLQIQKLDLKLEQFSELEHLLKLERKDLERRRQSLFLERLEFQQRMKSVEDSFERALTLSPEEAVQSVREVVKGAVSGGKLSIGQSMGAEDVSPLGADDGGYKTFNI